MLGSRQILQLGLSVPLVLLVGLSTAGLPVMAAGRAHLSAPAVPHSTLGQVILGHGRLHGVNDWRVGDFGDQCALHPLIKHWNGHEWLDTATNVSMKWNAYLFAAAAISAHDAWAVGTYQNEIPRSLCGPGSVHLVRVPKYHPLVEHWNGQQWTVVHVPSGTHVDSALTSISAISSRDIWASGSASWGAPSSTDSSTRPLIERFNGKQWGIIRMPNQDIKHRDVSEILALSDDDVWFVGDHWNPNVGPHTIWVKTLIEHWNGSQWSVVPSPNTTCHQNVLASIHITSAHSGWATGGGNYCGRTRTITFREHWNGTTWSLVHGAKGAPAPRG